MTIPALFWWRCPSETEKTVTMIYGPRTSKIEDIRKLLPIPMPPIPRHVIAAPVVSSIMPAAMPIVHGSHSIEREEWAG
jgi:hypothetical protein